MSNEQKENSSKIPEMSDLEKKYIGESEAKKATPQNSNDQTKKLEDLINRMDEAVYGVIQIRDRFIDEVNRLEVVSTRTSKAFRIFEHQIDSLGRINADIIQHYQTEMKKIAQDTVNNTTKELTKKVSEEVDRQIGREAAAIRNTATGFNEAMTSARSAQDNQLLWRFGSMLAAAFIGCAFFYALVRFF